MERTLSVVKTHYGRGPGSVPLAKRHVRYAVHRTDELGRRQWRQVWDRQGALDKQEAYRRLDQVRPGDYVNRIVLSPHPEYQDGDRRLDLTRWGREVLERLEAESPRPVRWFAVTHATPEHRHIHAVVVTRGKLDAGDLRTMREQGDRSALEQSRGLGLGEPLQRRPLEAEAGW